MKKYNLPAALPLAGMVALLLGYVGAAFFELGSTAGLALGFVGRFAGPVLFYLLVEGYYASRNILKATNLLAVFAAVSYLPYILYATGGLPQGNTFLQLSFLFTLLIGVYILRARHEIKSRALRYGAIAGLVALSVLADWPVFGPLIVLMLDTWRDVPRVKWAVVAGLCVLSAIPENTAQWPFIVVQLGQLVPLMPLYFMGRRVVPPSQKGFVLFCVYYVVFLLVIYLLKLWLGVPWHTFAA